MAPDDYSDSDDESDVEDIQTNVLLGVADGPISSPSDLVKPRISRIGGYPAYPSGTPTPPPSVSQCQSCSEPMELLVQLWCPFESSAFDRTLHMWACSRVQCQRKEGSVKAIRALRYNSKYAAKLEAKRLRESARNTPAPKQPAVNPFSSTAASAVPQLFGGGFGNDDEATTGDADESSGDPSSASDNDDSDDEDDEVTSALRDVHISKGPESASTAETAPVLTAIPSHPPLYLDTLFEYITPNVNNNAAAGKRKKATLEQQDSSSAAAENQWGVEAYEKTQGIDEVFAHFVSRVENESQQCVRYDLSGVPLPFASDAVYKRIFPLAHTVTPTPGTKIIATGGKEVMSTTGALAASDGGGKRTYHPTVIPPCEACGGPRAFECQLMPNLINVIRQARRAREDSSATNKKTKTQTDEERRAEVTKLLRGGTDKSYEGETRDMEWGTCMVFSCVQNCCRVKNSDGKWSDTHIGWKDEFVLVQWDA